MVTPTIRFVRCILLPVSYFVFLAGTLVSGAIFYRDKPFDPKAAILSDLQSPDDNPHGYLAAAAATAVSALLLVPAAAVYHQLLRGARPRLAFAGSLGLTAGLASAIALGLLAHFTHDYTPLHVQLASATFTGICAGTWFHLLAARAARVLIAFQLCALLALVYLCYGPVEFNNGHVLTSLAFWEWVVCADCGVALWAVARAVESGQVPALTSGASVMSSSQR